MMYKVVLIFHEGDIRDEQEKTKPVFSIRHAAWNAADCRTGS